LEGRASGEGGAPGQRGGGEGREPILFIDTDMYVMKVWSEFVFGSCDPWILEQIVARRYDGYLLCRTDLPWTYDVLREYPDDGTREKLFHIYRDLLINQGTPWAEIGGQADERLNSAIGAVEEILGQGK
jgi:nicotinamide riboside kinase